MEQPASPFARFDDQDVTDLVAEYPLAWVCPFAAGAGSPSLLPLLMETDAAGRPAALLGHMARRNPQVAAFTADPRATELFRGPHAYVSTRMVSDARWAPTWNYAWLDVRGPLHFEPGAGAEALLLLTEALDAAEATGWRPEMVGDRYEAMQRAIVAFRIRIESVTGRFKLGQDEKPARLAEILARHPDQALTRWMRRFNAYRLPVA